MKRKLTKKNDVGGPSLSKMESALLEKYEQLESLSKAPQKQHNVTDAASIKAKLIAEAKAREEFERRKVVQVFFCLVLFSHFLSLAGKGHSFGAEESKKGAK